jgi:hypothetical protein
MPKKNLDRLTIYFEIGESDAPSTSPQPSLTFKMSNYGLSMNEILRAKLRPDKFSLDNNVTYIKNSEETYFNKNEKNMLELKYKKQ